MDYKAIWHEDALRDLRELDQARQKAIIDKVKTYLVKDPLSAGKRLRKEFKGLYRMRFEDYRVIYAIDRKEMTVIVARVKHRKDAYK